MQQQAKVSDVLIIGSGLSGLACALKLPSHLKVTILAKGNPEQTNTNWAQGGIAAVLSEQDSFENHIHDTLSAGHGLCRPQVVRTIIEQAPQLIRDLQNWGVEFDFDGSGKDIDLTREGGHSHRRIVHVEDHTGSAIQAALLKKIESQSNIQILHHHMLVDLVVNKTLNPQLVGPSQVVGAYVLDAASQQVATFLAGSVVLATGGAGKVYLYTSNWEGATGDGMAAAFRAGARLSNLEFMQFHPTALYHHKSRNFLISEALRGEGGELINSEGQAFMKDYHPMGSLAPRDIVARAIDTEIKKSGKPCVYLDIRSKGADFIKKRFPHIYQHCLQLQIDITQEPIPVVPAAHYLCGGIVTNTSGMTDLVGLYAIGETACTGLHGANRLASNSLLECLYTAHACALDITQKFQPWEPQWDTPLPWVYPPQNDADELIVIHHMWDEIRALMWNYVGIVRSDKRLKRAHERLNQIHREVLHYYQQFQPHPDLIELRNLALLAYLTVLCASKRKESRGIHFNLNYPDTLLEPATDTVIWPGEWMNSGF